MIAVYTPGHSQNATEFMAKRSLESHGAFFAPHLASGLSVLDCGCGPGSITLGIAAVCAPAKVVGIDFGASQIERALPPPPKPAASTTSSSGRRIAMRCRSPTRVSTARSVMR